MPVHSQGWRSGYLQSTLLGISARDVRQRDCAAGDGLSSCGNKSQNHSMHSYAEPGPVAPNRRHRSEHVDLHNLAFIRECTRACSITGSHHGFRSAPCSFAGNERTNLQLIQCALPSPASTRESKVAHCSTSKNRISPRRPRRAWRRTSRKRGGCLRNAERWPPGVPHRANSPAFWFLRVLSDLGGEISI
jgi:hypothetical protein